MNRILVLIFFILLTIGYIKINGLQQKNKKEYDNIVKNFGENDFLKKIKERKLKNSDLEEIKIELIENTLNQFNNFNFKKQKWNEIKNGLTSDNFSISNLPSQST